jgi:hypothetical protein
MCAGSVAAGIKEKAGIGDALVVKDFEHVIQHHPGFMLSKSKQTFRLFALQGSPESPVCIECGSTVLFRNLPPGIQERAAVSMEAKAVLVNPDVDFHVRRDDVFAFDNGNCVKLSELPQGTKLDVIPATVELPSEISDAVQEALVAVR